MKKKNGFIATSLIYSFFLVFITLFLGIIASYLQDKVLLNSIEKSTKKDLNTSISIKDLEVGDVFTLSDSSLNDFFNIKSWIVASINGYNLTLYSYDLIYEDGSSLKSLKYDDTIGNYVTDKDIINCNSNCSILKYGDLNSDIDPAYTNATFYNKIIYNFNRIRDGYNLNGHYVNYGVNCDASGKCGTCPINGEYNTNDLINSSSLINCIADGDEYKNYKRIRYVWNSNNKKIKNEKGEYTIENI